jgi:hypothetical protein
VRLRLWRRRLTISAPRVAVRSALPWPLRWLLGGLVLGLSAALGLWAFEFGRDVAGLDRHSRDELRQLRADHEKLQAALEKAQAVANTAESQLTAERVAQERLASQLRDLEERNRQLYRELGFFEQLMPASGGASVTIRGFRAQRLEPGRVSWQLLVLQPARNANEFRADMEITLAGTLDGKPWSLRDPGGRRTVGVKQYLRMQGEVVVPSQAVVHSLAVRFVQNGNPILSQTVRLTD